jgi:preprotein translocase subunit YajC
VSDLAGLLPFVLIALLFWFLLIRPQRRRQQELAATQRGIGPGTQVMLGSGIYGTVTSVEDDAVHLEVAPGTVMKVARQAVVRVVNEPAERASDAPAEASDATPEDDQHQ